MLEIELLETGQASRFRITREGNPARLLILMVQEVGSEEPLWGPGPVDMVMTQGITFTMIDGEAYRFREATRALMVAGRPAHSLSRCGDSSGGRPEPRP